MTLFHFAKKIPFQFSNLHINIWVVIKLPRKKYPIGGLRHDKKVIFEGDKLNFPLCKRKKIANFHMQLSFKRYIVNFLK